MKKYYYICYSILLGFAILSLFSCKKYLDKRPSSQLYVPEKWQDLQALLDNNLYMNSGAASALPQALSDDYYTLDNRFESLTPDLKGVYIWDDSFTQVEDGWMLPYQAIYYSNVVLDELGKINKKIPIKEYQNLEGSALFYRSLAFHYLLQLYCKPYSQNPINNLGIVLKLTGSITEKVSRSSVEVCYKQIVNDLKKSIELLPLNSQNLMRPSSVAARALLARVYLTMSDFENSLLYSELAIKDKATLLNYNDLTPSETPGMPSFTNNPELLFFSTLRANTLTTVSYVIIDSNLYDSYEVHDIRKVAFFTPNISAGVGKFRFKGSYNNLSPSSVFYGLTIGEMYLISAECFARKKQTEKSLERLNVLLRNRYITGSFVDYSIDDPNDVLNIVLSERRKELVSRGLRWSDIKRLNADGGNIILRRELADRSIMLLPNDPKSVLLIPQIEITRSGIQQNIR